MLLPEDCVTKGELAPVASIIVLQVLYAARVGRPDTLWSVNSMAREVTRWNVECDKRLKKLMQYLRHTTDWAQLCFVGDNIDDCWLA